MDDLIKNFEEDVLIIHGDSDDIVPISVSEHAVDIYPSATLVSLEGAGHVFYGEDAVTAGERTIEFMRIHIR